VTDVNAGLDGVDTGLVCTNCGGKVTAGYIAHGQGSTEDLVGEAMQDLVAAAVRAHYRESGQPPLCSTCAPPPLPRPRPYGTARRPTSRL
jgi:tRNA U54 and U55 pseudouridine synthase Pus10